LSYNLLLFRNEATCHCNNKLPAKHGTSNFRLRAVRTSSTKEQLDPQQLDPELKGVSALEFPVTLVVISKGREFAVYRQEKATKDGGVTHPVCTMYERAVNYPLDLFLASDRLPDYLLGAELHGNAVPLTNYRIYPLTYRKYKNRFHIAQGDVAALSIQ
jgi:hypothetical protein